MGKYLVHGQVTIDVKTLVEAFDEEEAENIAADREVEICVHGTNDEDGDDHWVYNGCNEYPRPHYIDEYN